MLKKLKKSPLKLYSIHAHNKHISPIRKFSMAVKPFGKGHDEVMEVNEYSICIKPKERDTCTYINIVAVPTICSPIINHGKKVAIEKHSFLKKLKLENIVKESNEEIDMLIGADNYWKLVSSDIKKMKIMG